MQEIVFVECSRTHHFKILRFSYISRRVLAQLSTWDERFLGRDARPVALYIHASSRNL